MVPQYENIQYKLLAFSNPFLTLFHHCEGENGKKCGAVSELKLAFSIPPILPKPPSINILVALVWNAIAEFYFLINYKCPRSTTLTPLGVHFSADTNTFINYI